MSLKNWQNFHTPGEPLKNFARSEPHNDWLKATYVGGTKKPKRKRDAKAYYQALKARWER
jgi:hypothetical protein